MPHCHNCFKNCDLCIICDKCKNASYCGTDCMHRHINHHRKYCINENDFNQKYQKQINIINTKSIKQCLQKIEMSHIHSKFSILTKYYFDRIINLINDSNNSEDAMNNSEEVMNKLRTMSQNCTVHEIIKLFNAPGIFNILFAESSLKNLTYQYFEWQCGTSIDREQQITISKYNHLNKYKLHLFISFINLSTQNNSTKLLNRYCYLTKRIYNQLITLWNNVELSSTEYFEDDTSKLRDSIHKLLQYTSSKNSIVNLINWDYQHLIIKTPLLVKVIHPFLDDFAFDMMDVKHIDLEVMIILLNNINWSIVWKSNKELAAYLIFSLQRVITILISGNHIGIKNIGLIHKTLETVRKCLDDGIFGGNKLSQLERLKNARKAAKYVLMYCCQINDMYNYDALIPDMFHKNGEIWYFLYHYYTLQEYDTNTQIIHCKYAKSLLIKYPNVAKSNLDRYRLRKCEMETIEIHWFLLSELFSNLCDYKCFQIVLRCHQMCKDKLMYGSDKIKWKTHWKIAIKCIYDKFKEIICKQLIDKIYANCKFAFLKYQKMCDNPLCRATVGNTKLKKCSKCRKVWYCSQRCQKYQWKYGHKYNCRLFEHSEHQSD